jgi:short-subunit dehydrogenase
MIGRIASASGHADGVSTAAMRPAVLITGAFSAIGAALARLFAAKGHALALVAPRDSRLAALADDSAASGRDRPLTTELDLKQRDAGLRIAHALAWRGLEPMILVNCAEIAMAGPVATLDRTDQLTMIDVNVRALTDLCLRFADSLVRRRGPPTRWPKRS